MTSENQPEILGPHAEKIKLATHAAVADATGNPHEVGEEEVVEAVANSKPEEQIQEKQVNPEFPFGTPDEIDWKEIDPVGHALLKEINLRPWMKSTEYCSGHPLDRFPEEKSELYPYVTGENVYQEIGRLEMSFIRGLIPDVYFRRRKSELRELGITRFYLNVNVYNLAIFLDWTRMLAALITGTTHSFANPLIVRFNPLRPGINISIHWDYWTLEEREMIHELVLQTLTAFPV